MAAKIDLSRIAGWYLGVWFALVGLYLLVAELEPASRFGRGALLALEWAARLMGYGLALALPLALVVVLASAAWGRYRP